MNKSLKKIRAVLLIFDLIAGVLLLSAWGQSFRDSQKSFGTFRETISGRGSENGEGRELSKEKGKAAEPKKIALSFDDGPHPRYTEELLDGLKERGAVATFFVTGEHAALHPEVIKRMQEEGHLVGNHTYSHMQFQKNSREKFKEELIETGKLLKEITGEEILYVRPPYGLWDKSLEQELNMIPVFWSLDPLDWCSDDASCITANVVDRIRENDIILMHDYSASSVTAALEIVDRLLEQGYVFVTVEEILLV